MSIQWKRIEKIEQRSRDLETPTTARFFIVEVFRRIHKIYCDPNEPPYIPEIYTRSEFNDYLKQEIEAARYNP